MKNALLISILAVLIIIAIMVGHRYQLVVHSPVVAKLDRVTGEVWIANSGKWYKIENQDGTKQVPPEMPATPATHK